MAGKLGQIEPWGEGRCLLQMLPPAGVRVKTESLYK